MRRLRALGLALWAAGCGAPAPQPVLFDYSAQCAARDMPTARYHLCNTVDAGGCPPGTMCSHVGSGSVLRTHYVCVTGNTDLSPCATDTNCAAPGWRCVTEPFNGTVRRCYPPDLGICDRLAAGGPDAGIVARD